jgi:hypothetical protein
MGTRFGSRLRGLIPEVPMDETGRRLLWMVGVPLLFLTVGVPLLAIVPERGVLAGLAWIVALAVVLLLIGFALQVFAVLFSVTRARLATKVGESAAGTLALCVAIGVLVVVGSLLLAAVRIAVGILE